MKAIYSAKAGILGALVFFFCLHPTSSEEMRVSHPHLNSAETDGAGQIQYNREPKKSSIFFCGFFDLGFASLKQSRAGAMRTGSSGFNAGLGFGAVAIDYLDFGAGFGVVFLEDRDPFWQMTTGGEMKSSVSVAYLFGQVGFQLPIPIRDKHGAFPVWVGSKLGYTKTWAGRDITNCADCAVEKLKFKGGAYLKPEIKVKIARRAWIGLAYTIFSNTADFLNMVGVTLSGNFN